MSKAVVELFIVSLVTVWSQGYPDSENKRRNSMLKNRTKSWSCPSLFILMRLEGRVSGLFQILGSYLKHRHFVNNRTRHGYSLLYIPGPGLQVVLRKGRMSSVSVGLFWTAWFHFYVVHLITLPPGCHNYCLPPTYTTSDLKLYYIILALCESGFYVKI